MNDIKISLCIPTKDRFDTFLKDNLTKYLQNTYINEIIISDENGEDVKKIEEHFPNDVETKKIKLYKNEKTLGPFLNKTKACVFAKNEWIALIDSDNYADETYFKNIYNYIVINKPSQYSILSPSFAKPNFDYRSLENFILTKDTLREVKNYDKKNKHILSTLLNTGNYVLNKTIINNLNIKDEMTYIPLSSACDVILMNTMFFEQHSEFQFHVLKDLQYDHVVHPGSTYLTTHQLNTNFNNAVYQRFDNMCL